jgi:hypothetical protein
MSRPLALIAAAVTAAGAISASACAHADPEPAPPGPAETTAPQADSPCADQLEGALTELPGLATTGNAKHLLQCSDGTWQRFLDPYPSSDLWLTTGPELVVHGSGRRNPEVKAGTWTATPQSNEAQCSAARIDVIGAGETSAPEDFSADPGQVLTLDISDDLFSVTLRGYCLWQRN